MIKSFEAIRSERAEIEFTVHEGILVATMARLQRAPVYGAFIAVVHDAVPDQQIGSYSWSVKGLSADLADAIAFAFIQYPGLFESVEGLLKLYRAQLPRQPR